jgi:hypothetical protein
MEQFFRVEFFFSYPEKSQNSETGVFFLSSLEIMEILIYKGKGRRGKWQKHIPKEKL